MQLDVSNLFCLKSAKVFDSSMLLHYNRGLSNLATPQRIWVALTKRSFHATL